MDSNHDKKLFTPGPLSCSIDVKNAMLKDFGSRDDEFVAIVRNLRASVLSVAGVSPEDYTAILLQGSGTFSVESVFQTSRPKLDEKVLILSNGAYGYRMKKICDICGIPSDILGFPEDSVLKISVVKKALNERSYSTVAMVHCETSSGIINAVEEIGALVKSVQPRASFFVDAMSSFGAIPIDFAAGNIDFLVTSANKCLQGVPGFGIIVAKKEVLMKYKGRARSLSLDLVDQYEGLERNGQFRFTPPTHTLLAFQKALNEFFEEGGTSGRSSRYKKNCSVIQEGMKRLGFKTLLPAELQGYIITSFCYPKNPNFKFEEFYRRLSDLGQLIYPGKVTNADSFRIGNIGNLYPTDMDHLLNCVEKALCDMMIPIPVQ